MSSYPAEWKTRKLGSSLSKVIDYRGKSVPKANYGVQLITARNVRNGVLDFTHCEYVPDELYSEWMDRGLPQPGDVLFTTEAPLGMVAPYPTSGRYALGQRLIALRADEINLHSGYLLQYLLSGAGKKRIFELATGSTALGIRQSELQNLELCLPPLPVQRKIAQILRASDAAIAQVEQLIAALQRRKQGLMQRLLTGQVRVKVQEHVPTS